MFFRSIFRIFLEYQALYARQLFELATFRVAASCNQWFGSSHYLYCQCLLKAPKVQNIWLIFYLFYRRSSTVFLFAFSCFVCFINLPAPDTLVKLSVDLSLFQPKIINGVQIESSCRTFY